MSEINDILQGVMQSKTEERDRLMPIYADVAGRASFINTQIEALNKEIQKIQEAMNIVTDSEKPPV